MAVQGLNNSAAGVILYSRRIAPYVVDSTPIHIALNTIYLIHLVLFIIVGGKISK
jgi:hypothetical protein